MEFETLEYIQEEKELVQEEIDFPRYGEKSTENAVGINSKEKYLFDINRGRVHLKKVTLQNRIQKTIILLRLDIGGPPHSNPPIDDEHAPEVLHGPHLHVYSPEFGDSMAYKLNDPFLNKINPRFDIEKFNTKSDIELYKSFLEFCNVANMPTIIAQFL